MSIASKWGQSPFKRHLSASVREDRGALICFYMISLFPAG